MKKITLTLLFFWAFFSAFSQMSNKPEGLKAGDIAPLFTTLSQNGEEISLKNLLTKGSVVVIFYRGQWCPYCNKQLSRINDSLSLITEKGASVIAITPETAENIAMTMTKTKASFPIIEDKGMAIMHSYKVNFAVDDKTIEKYKGYGIDFTKANGDNGANLPVPATYIISKEGKITYVFFNADYSKRASVKDIIDNL